MARQDSTLVYTGPGDESTLGTNVQVAGVDELDSVKAVGDLIYDLDGRGNLRITDGRSLEVRSLLDVTPGEDPTDEEIREGFSPTATVSQVLVGDGRVAVFGEEYEVSEPIPGDPSATIHLSRPGAAPDRRRPMHRLQRSARASAPAFARIT